MQVKFEMSTKLGFLHLSTRSLDRKAIAWRIPADIAHDSLYQSCTAFTIMDKFDISVMVRVTFLKMPRITMKLS
jgi:hypothetical protein